MTTISGYKASATEVPTLIGGVWWSDNAGYLYCDRGGYIVRYCRPSSGYAPIDASWRIDD